MGCLLLITQNSTVRGEPTPSLSNSLPRGSAQLRWPRPRGNSAFRCSCDSGQSPAFPGCFQTPHPEFSPVFPQHGCVQPDLARPSFRHVLKRHLHAALQACFQKRALPPATSAPFPPGFSMQRPWEFSSCPRQTQGSRPEPSVTPYPKPNTGRGRQGWDRDAAESSAPRTAPTGKLLSRNAHPTAGEINDAGSPTFNYPLIRMGRAQKSLGCLEKG